MPHCILEHSANIVEKIEPESFFKALHSIIIESGPFDLERIKSRVIRHESYYIGDGDPKNAFVVLQISILTGRDLAIRQSLSERALRYLEEIFDKSRRTLNCSVTVEIREVDRATHRSSAKIT